ncbi:DGQHR domain-containing protein [Mesorhizobium sp.]|uniref:DGQHR domain-containing protein n=1 Tax=Mesorhizobium sp. TaxID=1871066 RepID=UPI0011FB2026|nr:DGQHR domain-containing protein [Mesorhizobium sp.]TIP18442.1 MAG: DGQHR domain-containing protein [Mesorhizobium sp.]
MEQTVIHCLIGQAAGRTVLLGFAPAHLLHSVSFADVLDEETGRGYQRRLNQHHSLDFRRYIQRDSSTTIPLTFNLRPRVDDAWTIVRSGQCEAELRFATDAGRIFAQVDCQHRLGHLSGLELSLPFMSFIGLTEREEMEIFNVINSKAKGLSASLLDFHDARLASDLATDRPELYIAIFLKNEPSSPWHQQLDLGGTSTSGMDRRASLRTFQKAIKLFLSKSGILRKASVDVAAQLVLDFWSAVVLVLNDAWSKPRKHLLTKGIGVYALMEIAAEIVASARPGTILDKRYFAAALMDFVADFDWSNDGPLKGLGGESGVKAAVVMLRQARRDAGLRVVSNG